MDLPPLPKTSQNFSAPTVRDIEKVVDTKKLTHAVRVWGKLSNPKSVVMVTSNCEKTPLDFTILPWYKGK
jgi:hypothetical protein